MTATTTKRISAFIGMLFDVTASLIMFPQIIYFAVRYSIVWESYADGPAEKLPAYICLAALCFFAYSYIRVAVAYNKSLRELYWEKGAHGSRKSRLQFLVKQPELWVNTAAFALIYLFVPQEWTCKALAVVMPAATFADKLLRLAVFLTPLFCATVLAHLSAYKRWERDDDPTVYNKKRRTKEDAYVSGVYAVGTGMLIVTAPYLVPILMFVYSLLTVGRVIGITILISLPFVFRLLRALKKRRSFLRSFQEICAEKGYTVSEIQKPYLSLLWFYDGDSFTLTIGEKSYSCKLVSARKKGVPIALSEDGTLTFIHSIGFRRVEFYRYTTEYNIGYESEHPKILIVNPVPKQVYVLHAGKTTEIDNGAKVGDYKFYAATGFLRGAELNILDK